MMERLNDLQALRCTQCREEIEIPRAMIGDPEGYMDFVEQVEEEHRCGLHVVVRNEHPRRTRVSSLAG